MFYFAGYSISFLKSIELKYMFVVFDLMMEQKEGKNEDVKAMTSINSQAVQDVKGIEERYIYMVFFYMIINLLC